MTRASIVERLLVSDLPDERKPNPALAGFVHSVQRLGRRSRVSWDQGHSRRSVCLYAAALAHRHHGQLGTRVGVELFHDSAHVILDGALR